MDNLKGILSSFLKKRARAKEKETLSRRFLENGGLLLEELISTSNGTYGIPIRNFSVQDLLTATNNFDMHNQIDTDRFYTLYKGFLEGRQIVVKKFNIEMRKYAIRDIAIMAQMSIHNNVLRPLGCCLEDEAISLVAEYAGERLLSDCTLRGVGRDNRPLSWKCRLRAAYQIANVLTYLHTALPRPIVHRAVEPSNFIIDQRGMVKLIDFSFSITIPLGKSRVEAGVAGTFGFLDPEYYLSSLVTEKTDVYSFGVLLLVLLSGRGPIDQHCTGRNNKNYTYHTDDCDTDSGSELESYVANDSDNLGLEVQISIENDRAGLVSKAEGYVENDRESSVLEEESSIERDRASSVSKAESCDENARFDIASGVNWCVKNDRLNKFVDPRILGEAGGGGNLEQKRQLQAFAALTLRCTQLRGDDRPEMIEVAKELRRIERSIPSLASSSNENQSIAKQNELP